MLLSQLLTEAADISPAELKERMKRDKRVSQIFKRDLKPDDIDNKKEFIDTLKYYLFNNKQALDLVKRRTNVGRGVGNYRFAFWRKANVGDILKQNDLDTLKKVVSDFFRDTTNIDKTDINKDNFDYLVKAFNDLRPQRYFNVYLAQELETFDLRPSSTIKVYVPYHFTSEDFNNIKKFDANYTLVSQPGKAVEFISRLKPDGTIDLQINDHLIVGKNREAVDMMAATGDATRQYARHAKGTKGFVVAILVKPENVVIDMGEWAKKEPPQSYIQRIKQYAVIKAGTYKGKIVEVFSDGQKSTLNDVLHAASAAELFIESCKLAANIMKFPFNGDIATLPSYWLPPSTHASIDWLFSPESKAQIISYAKKVYALFKEAQQDNITADSLNTLASKPDFRAYIDAAKGILLNLEHVFSKKKTHGAYVNPGEDSFYLPEDLLNSPKKHFAPLVIARTFLSGKRNTERIFGFETDSMAKLFGITGVKDVHRSSGAVQQEVLDKIFEEFYIKIGKPRPSDKKVQADEFVTYMSALIRLSDVARALQAVNEKLLQINKIENEA